MTKFSILVILLFTSSFSLAGTFYCSTRKDLAPVAFHFWLKGQHENSKVLKVHKIKIQQVEVNGVPNQIVGQIIPDDKNHGGMVKFNLGKYLNNHDNYTRIYNLSITLPNSTETDLNGWVSLIDSDTNRGTHYRTYCVAR